MKICKFGKDTIGLRANYTENYRNNLKLNIA